MICTKCGLEIDAGAAFCGNCGQPVQASTPVGTPAPVQAVAPAPVTSAPAAIVPAQPMNPASVANPVAPLQPAPTMSGPGAMAAAPAPGPAYGVPGAYARPGGGKAIAGFVLGVIGLIGWLIPFVGLILGVLALIFGTMTTKSSHRNLAITSVVLGSITIFMSLGAFVYNIQEAAKRQAAGGSAYSSSVNALSASSKAVVNALITPRN